MSKRDDRDLDQLKSELLIERDSLDEEAIRQPNSYFHVSENFVFAAARRDKAKHDLEVVVAELDRDVRDAMQTDGDKITEALVKAQITREQDYQRAYGAYLDSCLEADRWEALRNAYRQRAEMLKGLIQLYQSNYFGEVTGAAERSAARGRFNERRGV